MEKLNLNNGLKSHEKLAKMPKMKKSVAFFVANSWLRNCPKMGKKILKRGLFG